MGSPPNIGLARVFGCDAYVHDVESDKVGPQAKKGIFVGVDYTCGFMKSPRWLVMDVDTRDIAVRKSVGFIEDLSYRRDSLRDFDERMQIDDHRLRVPLE